MKLFSEICSNKCEFVKKMGISFLKMNKNQELFKEH